MYFWIMLGSLFIMQLNWWVHGKRRCLNGSKERNIRQASDIKKCKTRRFSYLEEDRFSDTSSSVSSFSFIATILRHHSRSVASLCFCFCGWGVADSEMIHGIYNRWSFSPATIALFANRTLNTSTSGVMQTTRYPRSISRLANMTVHDSWWSVHET